jgi:hypothetical protein
MPFLRWLDLTWVRPAKLEQMVRESGSLVRQGTWERALCLYAVHCALMLITANFSRITAPA